MLCVGAYRHLPLGKHVVSARTSLSARLERFDNKVTQTKASVAALHQRLHWWVAFAVIVLTVLMAWFGISQIGMLGHGWRCLHSDLPSATAR